MSGKHDKKPDDEQAANLLLTGPIVIRGLGRSVKDALLPGRPSRHRAFAGEAVPEVGAVDPTPVGLMLAGGPVVTESGPSTNLSERDDTQAADAEHAVPQDGAVTPTEVADGPGEDRVDDRPDDEPPADAAIEQPGEQRGPADVLEDGAGPVVEDPAVSASAEVGSPPEAWNEPAVEFGGVDDFSEADGTDPSDRPTPLDDEAGHPLDHAPSVEGAAPTAEGDSVVELARELDPSADANEDTSEQSADEAAPGEEPLDELLPAATAEDGPAVSGIQFQDADVASDEPDVGGEPSFSEALAPSDEAEPREDSSAAEPLPEPTGDGAGGGAGEAAPASDYAEPQDDESAPVDDVEEPPSERAPDVLGDLPAAHAADSEDPPAEHKAEDHAPPLEEPSTGIEEDDIPSAEVVASEADGTVAEEAPRVDDEAESGAEVVVESHETDPVETAEELSTQRRWTSAEELFSNPRSTASRAGKEPPAGPTESIDDFTVAADQPHESAAPDDTASGEDGAVSEQTEPARAQQSSAVIAPAAAVATAAPRPPKPSGSGGAVRPPRRPRPVRERFGREAVGIAVLVVLALICGGLITAVVLKTQRDAAIAAQEAADYTPPPLATPEPTSTGPVVAVIGDGTTSAAASGVTSAERWSTVLAKSLDGTVDAAASGGTGYAAKGNSGGTFVTAAATVPSNADVVVFFGGAADSNVSTLSLAKAATDAFSTATEQAQDAKLIVVGPAVADGVPTADLTVIRNTLRSSAGIAKATWIDPIDKDWLSTAKQAGKPTDLTVADEKTLASKMETAITAALK